MSKKGRTRRVQAQRHPSGQEGFDGSGLHELVRDVPGTRMKDTSTIRCRPGTFEWRYARAQQGTELHMLYLAGADFGRLWERAGMDGPGTVDWAKSGTPQWRGLPDARTVALDEVKHMSLDLGKLVTARLVNYVVQGKTSGEVARMYGYESDRAMAAVLDSDLRAAARFFHYITRAA